jgi:hypothetical protein
MGRLGNASGHSMVVSNYGNGLSQQARRKIAAAKGARWAKVKAGKQSA